MRNNMAKEKMSLEKKTKLIYSGELMLFAILFLVLATLEILNIIGKRPIMLNIFNFVTAAGGTWMIVDFFWVLFSKKRRKKNSLLDKALLIPLGIYLITFDIIVFTRMSAMWQDDSFNQFRRLMMGIAFYYIGSIFLFESIYHYFVPVPTLVEAIQEAYKAEQEEMEKERLAALKEDSEIKKEEAVDAEVSPKEEDSKKEDL